MTWHHEIKEHVLPRSYYRWSLERPVPALPYSYFWTWDHSTNWMLEDPGLQMSGCYNRYFKQPETYREDYRRLTDLCAGLGVRGIVIWGFLRDDHGGVEGAKRLTAYATERGVGIYPGIGITAYNGVYYEGNHRYCLLDFLHRHPEARMLQADGTPHAQQGCVAHPLFREWFAESIDWLFREFDIQGCNLENGDFLVDHHPLLRELRRQVAWPEDDSEPAFNQAMSYQLALESIPRNLDDLFASYATYCGFNFGDEPVQNGPMGSRPPAALNKLSEKAFCQWTLSGMLLQHPLPLARYLDDGAPAEAFDNPNWPRDLRVPTRRSVGFVHQGSQWWGRSRHQCVISSIKEACLRAYRTGLQGVSIHGEVSSRYFPAALNYLAFSHFIHWPEDTMRDFGRKTLGQIFASAQDGEDFAEILCHWDAQTLTQEHLKLADPSAHGFPGETYTSRGANTDEWQRARLWVQLHEMVLLALERYSIQMPAPYLF